MVTIKVFSKIGITYFVEKNNIISAQLFRLGHLLRGSGYQTEIVEMWKSPQFFYKKVLTNHLDNAIIQSQVEGNRTRAGEGRNWPKSNKIVTKNFFEKN